MPARAGGHAVTAAEFAALFAGLAGDPAPILVAVSGGPDSTCLLGALAEWAAERGGRPGLLAATVDHRLRPESRSEAEAVGAFAGGLAVPHRVLAWQEPRPARVSQALARAARYRLLARMAREAGADRVVTAHTLDDQAETILMRLAAGSGLTGLAGIRDTSCLGGIALVRPFLSLPKARLVATCRARGWTYASDPSNADRRHARARWRDLAPLLAAEGLTPGRLARFAARARRADDALARKAAWAAGRCRLPSGPDADGFVMDGRLLASEPAEIALRVLAAALAESGAGPVRLARLEACLDALIAAVASGRAVTRTLAGRRVALDRAGLLSILPEASRRRGRAVTAIAVEPPHSLGIPCPDA